MVKQNSLKLISFEPEHLELIEAREYEAKGLLCMPGMKDRLAVMADLSTEKGTFVADGKIICCAGFMTLWEGVAEIWILPSVHVPKYVREFAQTMKAYITKIMGAMNYHRIQTACLDDKLHHRWMKWLGLQPEGVFRQYTHMKEDFCMFAKVK